MSTDGNQDGGNPSDVFSEIKDSLGRLEASAKSVVTFPWFIGTLLTIMPILGVVGFAVLSMSERAIKAELLTTILEQMQT